MRRTATFVLPLLLIGCASNGEVSPHAPAAHDACLELIQTQAAAWNEGDLEGFAAGYHQTDDLVFTGKGGTTTGFDGLLERYRKSYPDRETMGQLSFTGLRFESLSPDEILAQGRWRLTREDDTPHGRFVLVLREIETGTWRIVLDYTTLEGS